MSRLDNRAYYDDFAGWYERERHLPYHRMLDDLEVELVERYATGRDVLEVGCGTGLILHRTARFARSAIGIDLSGGMLMKAQQRGLRVAQASATALPIATASVDVAYSFKVLAHVADIQGALREMARVVRRGGRVAVLELSEPPGGIMGALARFHVHTLVPRLGALLSGAREYRYLQQSIASFPEAPEFAAIMRGAGLEILRVLPLTFGVAHLYVATPALGK